MGSLSETHAAALTLDWIAMGGPVQIHRAGHIT